MQAKIKRLVDSDNEYYYELKIKNGDIKEKHKFKTYLEAMIKLEQIAAYKVTKLKAAIARQNETD